MFLRVSIGEQSFLDRIECPGEGGAWSSDGTACTCDLDANDVVDGADLGILMAAWGSCS